MRKDPLEAERDFRQQIEGAAKSRRQAERSRHWLRTLALLFFKRPGTHLAACGTRGRRQFSHYHLRRDAQVDRRLRLHA